MFPVSNNDPILLVFVIEYHLQHLDSCCDSKVIQRQLRETTRKYEKSKQCICFCTGSPESVCGGGGYLMQSFQAPFSLKNIYNSISPAVPTGITTLVISKLFCTVTTFKPNQRG